MDQFNKILAVFLLLIVAVGLALFVFSRLGLLGKIFPSAKTTNTQVTNSLGPTSTPIPLLSPTPSTAQTGLLGWIAKLRGEKTTPTPTQQKQAQPPTQQTTTADSFPETPQTTQPTTQTITVAVTVVPFGSTSPTSYPASGAETLLVPLAGLGILLGRRLHKISNNT